MAVHLEAPGLPAPLRIESGVIAIQVFEISRGEFAAGERGQRPQAGGAARPRKAQIRRGGFDQAPP